MCGRWRIHEDHHAGRRPVERAVRGGAGLGYATAFVREGEDGCTLVHDARGRWGRAAAHRFARLARRARRPGPRCASGRSVRGGGAKRLYKRAAKKAVYELMRGVCGRSPALGARSRASGRSSWPGTWRTGGRAGGHDTLRDYYDVSPEEGAPGPEIAAVQRPLVGPAGQAGRLHRHHFCRTRCLYCSASPPSPWTPSTATGSRLRRLGDPGDARQRARPARRAGGLCRRGHAHGPARGELAKILQAAATSTATRRSSPSRPGGPTGWM